MLRDTAPGGAGFYAKAYAASRRTAPHMVRKIQACNEANHEVDLIQGQREVASVFDQAGMGCWKAIMEDEDDEGVAWDEESMGKDHEEWVTFITMDWGEGDMVWFVLPTSME